MPEMTYFAPNDLLGLANGTSIIIASNAGGERKQYTEVLGNTGAFITTAPVAVRPHEEHSIEYEVLSGDLTVNVGQAVNTSYFVTGLSVSCSAESYPRVSVTFVKFSNVNKFNTGSKKCTIVISGGHGVVNLYGATAAGAIGSSMSLSSQAAETISPTGGEFQEGGYGMFGIKQDCSIESTTAITIPVAGFLVSANTRGGNSGATVYSSSWLQYPTVT